MKQTSERLMPAFFILGLLVLWEGAVRIFGIPLYVLPSPVQVAETLVQELPVLALHTGSSMLALLRAFQVQDLVDQRPQPLAVLADEIGRAHV